VKRVEKIERSHKQWVNQQNGIIPSEDIEEFERHANDIQFLIDTVKQQEMQINQLEGQLNTKNALYKSASRDRDKLYKRADKLEKALKTIRKMKGKRFAYVEVDGKEKGIHISEIWNIVDHALSQ